MGTDAEKRVWNFMSLPQIVAMTETLPYYGSIVRVDGAKANKDGHLGV